MTTTIAYCFRDGVIGFGESMPNASIGIAHSTNKEELKEFIGVRARNGYTKDVLLVPGIPEAKSDEEALVALEKWLSWLVSKPRQNLSFDFGEIKLGAPT